jgi:hypothetical protein
LKNLTLGLDSMSDLQIALIALGAIIVGAVIVYNWWQERRLMRENSWRFDDPADDALMEHPQHTPEPEPAAGEEETFRIDEPERAEELHAPELLNDALPPVEPTEAVNAFQQGTPDQLPEEQWVNEPVSIEPEPQSAVTPDVTQPVVAGPVAGYGELPATVNEQIDLIALLQLPRPVEAGVVTAALRPIAGANKSRQCLAQDANGIWYDLAAQAGAEQFIAAACAQQLADRRGPITEAALNQFQAEIQTAAAAIGATLQWLGAENALPHATELDQFGMDVDVMVGFHVLPGENGSFAGTKLRGLAEAGGMQLDADGAFHAVNEAEETLFTLISQDKRPFRPETLRTLFYRGLTFQLDVPRVANCSDVFSQMVQVARKLQLGLGGQLVDDNQRPLGEAEIEKIRQQLKAIQARMTARGIPPGSATALRLFS